MNTGTLQMMLAVTAARGASRVATFVPVPIRISTLASLTAQHPNGQTDGAVVGYTKLTLL